MPRGKELRWILSSVIPSRIRHYTDPVSYTHLDVYKRQVCDGAKASCAAKIASSVDAGILGYNMYLRGQQFYAGEDVYKRQGQRKIKMNFWIFVPE